jgi:hypothetical protein
MAFNEQQVMNDPVNVGIAGLESGGDYSAKNPESTASGKYQFIEDTFLGVQKNNPDLPKVNFEQFKKDPAVQEQYQAALRQENQSALKKRGIDVSPSNEYIFHWAGAPKGTALLKAPDDAPLGDFFSDNVLKKNRLTADMSVGEFKQSISDKMIKAMGKSETAGAGRGAVGGPNYAQAQQARLAELAVKARAEGNSSASPSSAFPVTPQEAKEISGDGTSGSGIKAAPLPLTLEQNTQLKELEKISAKIATLDQGTPEYNMAVADGLKKNYGPNWSMALASALFGDKQGALMWVTGGKNSAPQIAEAKVGGGTQQVWINKNERGDTWFTDPKTGARLPDNIVITATTPEGSIATAQARASAQVSPNALAKKFSGPEAAAHANAGAVVQERAPQLGKENILVTDISRQTKKFSDALSNALRSPNAEAFAKAINSIKGGLIDEAKLKEAATLANINQDDRGDFQQFLRNIANINKNDIGLEGKHGPGAGAHGILDLEGGAQGIQQWLAKRSGSYAAQDAWNNYYEQYKADKTVQEIANDFMQSDTYVGIKNYEKLLNSKMSGKKANIADGDPIADYDRRGRLIVKKYNSKTGKAE